MKHYDYSPLPVSGVNNDTASTIGVVAGMGVGLLAALTAWSLGARGDVPGYCFLGGIVAGVILALLIVGLTDAYHKKIRQFVTANTIPPANVSLAEVPNVLTLPGARDQKIDNAYTFSLADTTDAMVFDYSYTVGSGKSQSYVFTPVLHFKVSSEFPEIYLDGTQNGHDTLYAESQRISLEGDFDTYFNLYVAAGEQVDALSIITPDIMQVLIDSGRPYDILIRGHDVYIFSSGHYFYTRTALPHVLEFAEKLLTDLQHRSASWKDALPGTPSKLMKVSFWRTAKGHTLAIIGMSAVFAAFYVGVMLASQ